MPKDARWRIELFGGVRAQCGDQIIARFPTQKAAGLLAYLAYHLGRAHPREVLIELFWPECEPDAGRQSLSQALSVLRRQLEPVRTSASEPSMHEPAGAVLLADRTCLQLNPAAVTTDVAEFEAALQAAARAESRAERVRWLEDAVERYQGELLRGHYQSWIQAEQERLSEAYFRAARQLTTHLEEAGDYPRALEYARRVVAADPLREEAHQELIRLLAAAGQPAAALRQYRELERRLSKEFGISPSAAARELLEQIRSSGDDRPPTTAQCSTLNARDRGSEAPGATPHLPLPLTRFFGREEEIARLTALLQPEGVQAFGCSGVQAEKDTACADQIGPHRPERLNARTPERPNARLVTLTGPGGSGKTRLALEAARCLSPAFRGAVWFVPLADLADPRQILGAVADALRLPRTQGDLPLGYLVEALSRQPSLLVLDNVEHLLEPRDAAGQPPETGSLDEDGASAVRTLLERVPTLTCLVTSRRRLGLAGEQEFPVLPLPTPAAGPLSSVIRPSSPKGVARGTPTPLSQPPARDKGPRTNDGVPGSECLMRFPSVQLFLDRAREVRPDFEVTEANAAALGELCRRLEGIPLALELAAAWAPVLTPAQMLGQMESRLDFPANRVRGGAARHRTLRTAMEWSYRLLSPELQQLLARLSVFRGGWTLEAAEAVCFEWGARSAECGGPTTSDPLPVTPHAAFRTPHMDALDCLAQLRECSLVLAEETPEGLRFRMLETVREYAGEQLTDEDRETLARRHAEYFVGLAERAGPELWRSEQAAWLDRLEREHPNLQAALEWSLASAECGTRNAESSDPSRVGTPHSAFRIPRSELGLRLAGAVWRFWPARGYGAEGREWLEALLSRPELSEPSTLRARALDGAGVLALLRDLGTARARYEEMLAIGRELGDKRIIATALNGLGHVAWFEPDHAAGRVFLEEGLAMAREAGDQWEIAFSLHVLGLIAARDDPDEGRRLAEEALAIRRELGDTLSVAFSLYSLGNLALRQGDRRAAHGFCMENLSIWRRLRSKGDITWMHRCLGLIAYSEGDYEAARSFYAEGLAIWQELGVDSQVAFWLANLGTVALARGEIGEAKALFEETSGRIRELTRRKSVGLGAKHCLVTCLAGLSGVAGHEGQQERAARLLGAARALRAAFDEIPHVQRSEIDRLLEVAGAQIDEQVWAAALLEGEAMTPEEAMRYALDDTSTGGSR